MGSAVEESERRAQDEKGKKSAAKGLTSSWVENSERRAQEEKKVLMSNQAAEPVRTITQVVNQGSTSVGVEESVRPASEPAPGPDSVVSTSHLAEAFPTSSVKASDRMNQADDDKKAAAASPTK
jgi:hypothetical protein